MRACKMDACLFKGERMSQGKSPAEIAKIVPCGRSTADIVKHNLGIVNGTEQMVEHHTHYFEIHGYDKTVWMTRSEHFKLHQRLRKNGECNVPVDELTKIASAACHRTDKSKQYQAKYQAKYRSGSKSKQYQAKYRQEQKQKRNHYLKNIWLKQYYTYMMPYIVHKETIRYNIATNHLSVSSGFYGTQKKKPLVINTT